MRLLHLIALLVLFGVAVYGDAQAAEDSQKVTFVSPLSRACPAPADANAEGGSPERAMALEEFEDASQGEFLYDEKGNRLARFSCKWIRISGFFVPMHYYGYRGELLQNVAVTYGRQFKTVKYIVENFADSTIRSSAIAHRRVTLVARFYNLCTIKREGRSEGLSFGGPCHYGDRNGMMLADVIVEKILDAAPQYLSGEQNRPVLGLAPLVEGEDRAVLIERVRAWAALVQRGAEAYTADFITQHPYYAGHEDVRRALHDDLTSADSYITYLSQLSAFQRLDTETAPVEVFWDNIDHADHYRVYGCICLKASCSNAWPLTGGDAEDFYGHAACTPLTRGENGWTFH